MKGVVFTEFLDMVESRYSAAMVDDIIDDASPSSGGAYTSVGTYPYTELAALTVALSKRCGSSVPELLKVYGRHLFGRFAAGYSALFEGAAGTFEFLKSVESVIHVEVRKLYPDAELPQFTFSESALGELRMVYHSPRCLGDFAHGLVEGCIGHFGESIALRRKDNSAEHATTFILSRVQ